VVVEAAWRLNLVPEANLLMSRPLSWLETSSAAAFVFSAFAIAASASSFFLCASAALLVRSSSDPAVEPVGVDPVCPVGPDDVGPADVGPDDVDPDGPADVDPGCPPEVVMGDIGGVLEPVKLEKGEVTASQTTVAPSSVDFWTKQYSSLSLR